MTDQNENPQATGVQRVVLDAVTAVVGACTVVLAVVISASVSVALLRWAW